VALIEKEVKTGNPEPESEGNPGSIHDKLQDDTSSYSGSFNDDPNDPTFTSGLPEIRESIYAKRGSCQSMEHRDIAGKGSLKHTKVVPSLLKKAVLNDRRKAMFQSMTAVHENKERSEQEGLCVSYPQCARTLEDLTDASLQHAEFTSCSSSNSREKVSALSAASAAVRSPPIPSVLHLSVSAAEPLRRKDLFYSRNTINLSTEGLNTSAINDRSTNGNCVDVTNECSDERLHKRLHNNKFVNGLLSMLGVEIFKDGCYDLLLLSGVIGFLGFFAPFMFLGAFAQVNKIDSSSAAFLISLIGIANTFGRPVFGMLVSLKILDSVRVMNVSIIVAGLSTMALPFLTSYWAMAVYCLLFGLAMAGHICMKSLALVQLMGVDALTNGLGFCLLSNGIATMLGGPFLALFYNEESQSFLLVFILAGVLLVSGGILGLPLQTISDWIKKRKVGKGQSSNNVARIVISTSDDTNTEHDGSENRSNSVEA